MNSVTESKSGASSSKKRRKNKGTRVAEVSRDLREHILSGDVSPGDKLPTEAGLTRDYEVSRTVVREAIAALRTAGLVEVRHGVGVFVCEPEVPPGTIKPVDRARISSMIELLEVRAALEIEAACLAAERRSPAQEGTLFERYDELDRLITAGQATEQADLAFHFAVADATNNPRFREFLTLMGELLIPRSALPESLRVNPPAGYMDQIQVEHRAIVTAVSERNIQAAGEAMRRHLKGSQSRYRRLIRGSIKQDM